MLREYPAWLAPRIVCKNGYSLSVQVGRTLYCTPRQDRGPHEAVEVGFITDGTARDSLKVVPPETWKQYAEDDWDDEWTKADVFAYVPVELVEALIESYGGRVEEPTP
jgi:hypothetical protein